MNLSRKSLLGTLALVATLSAPLAFAQSTPPSSSDPSTQSGAATTATPAAMPSAAQPTTSNDAAAAATQGDPAKKSWADVDADKDGNLSKAEASMVPALAQAFDKADANADGSLTAAEYKAYVKKSKK